MLLTASCAAPLPDAASKVPPLPTSLRADCSYTLERADLDGVGLFTESGRHDALGRLVSWEQLDLLDERDGTVLES